MDPAQAAASSNMPMHLQQLSLQALDCAAFNRQQIQDYMSSLDPDGLSQHEHHAPGHLQQVLQHKQCMGDA